MKEYIVLTEEDGLYYNGFDYHELIHCEDCRFYFAAIPGSCSGAVAGKHAGICRHPQGCIATDPWGYCHYALRKEDAPGEDQEA